MVDPGRERALLRTLWLVWAALCCLLPMAAVDPALSQLLRGADDQIIEVFRRITVLGEARWYLVPLGVAAPLLLLAGRRLGDRRAAARCTRLAWALIFVFAVVAVAGLATDLIKPLVGRARPKLLDQQGFYGFLPLTFRTDFRSFPSGHATTAMALAAALGCLLPRWRVVLLALGGALALTRVAVNAHFLGDVIGGATVAAFTTLLVRDWFAGRGLVFGPQAGEKMARLGPPVHSNDRGPVDVSGADEP
ncbi:MAG: phosphatase PAP2 family protein [Azospirillum sp.]|nr:phosphatase PAP2 family protein [Azospirillum sp.]